VELIGGGGTKAAAVYSSVQAGKTSLTTLNGEVSIASRLDSILGAVGSKIESAVASVPATLPIIAAMSMDLRVRASCYADAVDPGAIERVQSNPEILLIQ
jgi:shikimate 5-dehydrogenase